MRYDVTVVGGAWIDLPEYQREHVTREAATAEAERLAAAMRERDIQIAAHRVQVEWDDGSVVVAAE